MKSAFLTCTHVAKYFFQAGEQISVLDDISVRFEQGKTYAIVGVSGTGKSTLINILAGLDTPTKGTVRFNECSLGDMSCTQLDIFRNRYIGLMFQFPYLIRELSVIENICLAGFIGGKTWADCFPKGRKLLERIHLKEKAHENPAALSGGQQQRIALLRAIFNEPMFLLADEPTGNLDEDSTAIIIELLKECQSAWGMGIIVSTHDDQVADAMDIVYRLEHGILKIQN